MDLRFPDRFMWGTATSAYQVEGGNAHSDWSEWERHPHTSCREPVGAACDHYRRYPEDLALLSSLGFGWYRFSIEWSRIEPAPGEWIADEVDHYRRVLECCRDLGMRAAVTLHHFTTPSWVTDRGGWEEPRTAEYFARFCRRVAAALGGLLDLVITINEPNMPALLGYEDGVFPPGKRDRSARLRATETFVRAHRLAREEVKAATSAPVGLAVAMAEWQAVRDGGDQLQDIRRLREDVFLDATDGDDYIGVNTYTRHRVGRAGFIPPEEGVELTMMGYEFWPEAVGATIRRAASYTRLPVIVTENGIGIAEDHRRVHFIERALLSVHDCIADGIDVRGYFYWSALDNYEWNWGFEPKFGLVAVDRDTQSRLPKPSAYWIGGVARSNMLSSSPSS